jgi:hypothetical protein
VTIILSSDTASLSSVMICCTAVATFNMSFLDELEACTDRSVAAHFSHLSSCLWLLMLHVLMQGSCERLLRWGQLREKNVLPEEPLGACSALLLCSSSFAWLQPQYNAGWGFSPSPMVQLQQLGIDSVSVFSGHSLCRWPPLHPKQWGGCLQLAQISPNFWQS